MPFGSGGDLFVGFRPTVAFADPNFWVMAALAMVAGTQAFMATVGSGTFPPC